MKKQFIAIILTVAMLVAMVPVFAVPAAAATTHKIGFAPAEITVDGELDDNYTIFSSQPIKSVYQDVNSTRKDLVNEELGFEGYALATPDGIYVWVSVYGDSDFENEAGAKLTDKSESFQVYYNMGENATDMGYLNAVFFDYENNIGFQNGTIAGATSAAVKTDAGWNGEVFIPWESGSDAAKAVANGETDFFLGLGFRYNDDYSADSELNIPNNKGISQEKDTDKNFNACAVDSETKKYNTDATELPTVELVAFNADFEDDDEGGSSTSDMRIAPFVDSAPTIDGKRDTTYAKGTKAINNKNYNNVGPKKGNGEMFEAYVLTTKDGFYVWVDIKDSTRYNLVKDGCAGDYLQIYYNMSESGSNITTNGYVQFDYNKQFKIANYGSTGGGLSASDITLSVRTSSEGWTAEVFVPWRNNSVIKNAVAEGKKDFFFAVGFQYNDDATDNGTAYRDNYYYDSESGGNYWSNYGILVPYQVVYFDGTPDIPVAEKINFSNVLTIGPNITDPVMRYTVLGANDEFVKEYFVSGTSAGENKYQFSLDIAPQYMSCKIKAELMYSGVVLASVTEASILDYCVQLANMKHEDSGLTTNQFLSMQNLIYNMLNYGAAAQIYTGYNTDNLVNKGYEDLAFDFYGIDYQEISKTEAIESYGAEFISMGVHFDSANHLYVKFTTEDDISNYKVTFSDGRPGIATSLYIEEVAGEANTYIAYSPAISPENYHYQYIFRLTNVENKWNNVVVQTAYCNVNAYLAEIIEVSANPAMVELAKAAYLYGAGVRAYLAS